MKVGVRDVVSGVLILAVSLLLSAGESAAAPESSPSATLKGTYARSVSRTCIQTNREFGIDDPDPGDISVSGSGADGFPQARWTSIRGKVVFNGDGTGSLESELGSLRMNSHRVFDVGEGENRRSARIGGRPFSRRTSTCTFEYSVSPDGSFVMSGFSCDSENLVPGRSTGNPSRVTGIVIRGQMAHGGQTLLLNDNDMNVESIATLDGPGGDPTGEEFERICVRSGTAVRVGN